MVDAFAHDGRWTPLMLACHASNLDMAQLLLDHGADPGLTNDQGRTALHYAVSPKNPAKPFIVGILVAHPKV